jgi:aubergine-like protein
MMEGALEAWKYYNNNQLPDRIIIYRDGVGDGQLSYIHDHELPQIQTKINEYIGEGYDHEPQLLYIVLKARFQSVYE